MFVVVFFDVHPDDVVMNFFIFRETDGFSVQAFDMRSKIQVFSLYFPNVVFADAMQVFRREQARVCAPIIRMTNSDGQSHHFVQQFLQHLICCLVFERQFALLSPADDRCRYT